MRTKDSKEKWWSVGHGTLFKGPNEKWWMVFHGYENGYYNMGRQTLLEPIEWTKEGWFKIPDGVKTDAPILKPLQGLSASNYSLDDDFGGHELNPQWQFFGGYDTTRFHLSDHSLKLKGKAHRLPTARRCFVSHQATRI
jgi:beta-xylosidase